VGVTGLAQAKKGEGTISQRLEVMSQKLETMRRSLKSTISVLEQENGGDKKGDKESADTPHARLTALEKETARLQSDINNLKGKVDRSEKYEAADVDQAEQSVADLQRRLGPRSIPLWAKNAPSKRKVNSWVYSAAEGTTSMTN
jgi:chromosome segregation ATPase